MKKILFFHAFVLTFLNLNAQVGFGPEAGVGASNMQFVPAPGFTKTLTEPILSWKLGGVVDLHPGKNIYVQSGLYFFRKGHSRNYSYYDNDSFNEAIKQSLNINYLELPITVLYKTGAQGKGRVFLGLGAAVSYILGGRDKVHAEGKYEGIPFSVNPNTQIVADKTLKAFDVGVNFTAGYELPTGLFFRANYVLGAKDIGMNYETDKNKVWTVSAGYFFGKGRNINKDADDLIDKGP
jgi:hypothetical protein